MIQWSKQTMIRLTGSSPDHRTKVIEIVRRHQDACLRAGISSEQPERVVIEAMDEVEAGRAGDYLEAPSWDSPEYRAGEYRSYEQYRSPVDCGRW